MEQLPSYEEATSRQDWLELVAPYVDIRDYTNLCLVSKPFNSQFVKRLWKEPIRTVRALRLSPLEGKRPFPFLSAEWLLYPVTDAAQSVSAIRTSSSTLWAEITEPLEYETPPWP